MDILRPDVPERTWQLQTGCETVNFELAERITGLPQTCFLHEVGLEEPIITIDPSSEDSKKVLIAYGPTTFSFRSLLNFKIQATFAGDGITKTFKLPMVGDRFDEMMISHLVRLRRRLRHLSPAQLPFLQ
jgi:hypothetical protein